MDFATLITEVELLVKDPVYFDLIPGYINTALVHAGSRVNFPSLKCVGTVVTVENQMFVPLTSDRMGRIKVISDTIAVYPNLEGMIDALHITDLTQTGPVEGVAVEGTNLWYWPIPLTPQTITFIGYLNPPALVKESDVPYLIPDHLQMKLLVHGAARYAFSKQEDGIDGLKVNTAWSESEVEKGILELGAFIGRSRTHQTSSTWRV